MLENYEIEKIIRNTPEGKNFGRTAIGNIINRIKGNEYMFYSDDELETIIRKMVQQKAERRETQKANIQAKEERRKENMEKQQGPDNDDKKYIYVSKYYIGPNDGEKINEEEKITESLILKTFKRKIKHVEKLNCWVPIEIRQVKKDTVISQAFIHKFKGYILLLYVRDKYTNPKFDKNKIFEEAYGQLEFVLNNNEMRIVKNKWDKLDKLPSERKHRTKIHMNWDSIYNGKTAGPLNNNNFQDDEFQSTTMPARKITNEMQLRNLIYKLVLNEIKHNINKHSSVK